MGVSILFGVSILYGCHVNFVLATSLTHEYIYILCMCAPLVCYGMETYNQVLVTPAHFQNLDKLCIIYWTWFRSWNFLCIHSVPERSMSDSPGGCFSGAPLLVPTGRGEPMCQEWVARSAYISSFISAKNVFVIKDQLHWHWGRDKCYLMCMVNKWLNGDQ